MTRRRASAAVAAARKRERVARTGINYDGIYAADPSPLPENFKSRGYAAIARNLLPSAIPNPLPGYYLDNNDLLSFV